mmetsp:Transcript_43972/g.127157  ORF Transcript_43972/g.127157 Transcript_43972/m.127157 type:complete len:401 (-) Transcript_43972:1148-2350(-)
MACLLEHLACSALTALPAWPHVPVQCLWTRWSQAYALLSGPKLPCPSAPAAPSMQPPLVQSTPLPPSPCGPPPPRPSFGLLSLPGARPSAPGWPGTLPSRRPSSCPSPPVPSSELPCHLLPASASCSPAPPVELSASPLLQPCAWPAQQPWPPSARAQLFSWPPPRLAAAPPWPPSLPPPAPPSASLHRLLASPPRPLAAPSPPQASAGHPPLAFAASPEQLSPHRSILSNLWRPGPVGQATPATFAARAACRRAQSASCQTGGQTAYSPQLELLAEEKLHSVWPCIPVAQVPSSASECSLQQLLPQLALWPSALHPPRVSALPPLQPPAVWPAVLPPLLSPVQPSAELVAPPHLPVFLPRAMPAPWPPSLPAFSRLLSLPPASSPQAQRPFSPPPPLSH